MSKIISFEGGSAFGKTTMINKFSQNSDFLIYPSISKLIYQKINHEWINPAQQYSDIFFDIRIKQYLEAKNNPEAKTVIFDRFLFFAIAVRIFSKMKVPEYYYKTIAKECNIDKIFLFEPIPLKEYEDGWPRVNLSYDQSLFINDILYDLIRRFGYTPSIVKFDTVENRFDFIKKNI